MDLLILVTVVARTGMHIDATHIIAGRTTRRLSRVRLDWMRTVRRLVTVSGSRHALERRDASSDVSKTRTNQVQFRMVFLLGGCARTGALWLMLGSLASAMGRGVWWFDGLTRQLEAAIGVQIGVDEGEKLERRLAAREKSEECRAGPAKNRERMKRRKW